VDKNGNVLGYQITHNSGNDALDLSVVRLLKKPEAGASLPGRSREAFLELPLPLPAGGRVKRGLKI